MTDSIDALLEERQRTHGDYAEHALITQALKFYCTTHKNYDRLNSMQRESMEMIFHKIGRILAGDPNFKDHWDDIAGYARLVAERL